MPPSPAAAEPRPQVRLDQIRTVTAADVLGWLAAGWSDFRTAGWISLAWGAIFVVAGFAVTGGLVVAGMPYLITPMIGGFLLVAPLLAMGLYDVSRQIERGEPPSLARSLVAWRHNAFHTLTAGLILMLFLMIWARLAVLVFALTFPYQSMSLESFVEQVFTPSGLAFLAIGTVVGAALATLAFLVTVVSLPMMIDRRTDFFSAAVASVAAVVKNPRPMALWATLIVAVTSAGILAGFVGLIVAVPLLGHASWHAYRGLVGE